MKQILHAELVLSVGSLCFFECKSIQFLFGRPTYYWKFRDSTVYYGPFNTLLDAGFNVDALMRMSPEQQATKAAPDGSVQEPVINEEPPKNVIKLDFKTKRRLT